MRSGGVLSGIIKLVDKAVLAGEARALDARVTALSIIGMTMWTAWWFQPEQSHALGDIAEQVAENAVALVRRTAPVDKAASIDDLAREIRENLALIERLSAKIE